LKFQLRTAMKLSWISSFLIKTILISFSAPQRLCAMIFFQYSPTGNREEPLGRAQKAEAQAVFGIPGRTSSVLRADANRFPARGQSLLPGMIGVLVILFASLCASLGQALDFRPIPTPPPNPPLLLKPPNPSAWTVRFLFDSNIVTHGNRETNSPNTEDFDISAENPEDREQRQLLPGSPGQIVRILHINSGRVQGFEVEYAHGHVEKMFSFAGFLLFDHPDRDEVLVIKPELVREFEVDHRADRFEGLEWISKEAYRGMTRFRGRECYVYELVEHHFPNRQLQRISEVDAAAGILQENRRESKPSQPARVLATALVDRQTRLPVLLSRNGEIMLYEFDPAGAPLELPERYAKALQAYMELVQKRALRYRIPQ
jgi:hypothetical protein